MYYLRSLILFYSILFHYIFQFDTVTIYSLINYLKNQHLISRFFLLFSLICFFIYMSLKMIYL